MFFFLISVLPILPAVIGILASATVFALILFSRKYYFRKKVTSAIKGPIQIPKTVSPFTFLTSLKSEQRAWLKLCALFS